MKIKHIITVLFLTISICTLTAFASAPEFSATSMRVEDPVGIRVTAAIDAPFANEQVEEYGFIVARKVFLLGGGLENTDLVLGCGIYYDRGISKGYENGEFVDRFMEKNDDTIHFAAYLHGIPAYYYPEIFVVRPYARLYDSSAIYGEPIEVSLYSEAKGVKANTGLYEILSSSQKAAVDGVIIAVEGEPYTLDRKDFRIVISSRVVKNANPTYSVCYDLFNPYTGEILRAVPGRKKSRSYAEIEAMLVTAGCVVPMSKGIVQDTADGYIASYLSDENITLIGGIDPDTMTLSHSSYDSALKCRDCIKKNVEENVVGVGSVSYDTPVTVINTADMSVNMSDIQSVMNKERQLLCYLDGENGVSYADFVKAYVSLSPEGDCEYIIVVVNPDENGAADEPCTSHTYFDVNFYADGELVDSQRVVYGGVPVLANKPSKTGYTFIGWAAIENGEVTDPEGLPVTRNTEYFAVFEIKKFDVRFYVGGELYEAAAADYNTCPVLPVAPKKPGHIFIGWSAVENGEAVNPDGIPVTDDTAYYAVFERENVYYDVVFCFDGEALMTASVLSGEKATAPEEVPETAEYTRFVGWSLKQDGTAEDIVEVSEVIIYENTQFYSVIETNPNSPEFLEKIQRGYRQLKRLNAKGLQKNALLIIKECVGYIVADALDFKFIDKNYAYDNYTEMVNEVKDIVKVQMTSDERSAFVSFLTNPKNIDEDVQDFIIAYFDINTNIN